MKHKILVAVVAAAMLIFGTSAYANSSGAPSTNYSGYSALDRLSIPTPTPKTATSKASRTISTSGNGHVVDNVDDTDSEKLQFITVTAKDGSVFYVVIDKQNTNDNVYFLNTVDVGDLEALTDDYTTQKVTATTTPAPSETTPTPEPSAAKKQKQEKQPISGNVLILIIAAIAAAGISIYYVKVIIPKKKLEDADDLEDFDFEDDEEVISEDDIYSEDDTGDEETDDFTE